MENIASEFKRDPNTLKDRLQHWFRFGDLKPEQGIALLFGLEADDIQLAALAEWGRDKKKDWGILNFGIFMLNGDVLKLSPNPKQQYKKNSHIESDTLGEMTYEFDGTDRVGYACSEAELELSAASIQAEVDSLTTHMDKAERNWLELLPGNFEYLSSLLTDLVQEHARLRLYWESDQHKHPSQTNLSYFIAWGNSKGIVPKWQSLAKEVELNIEQPPVKSTGFETWNEKGWIDIQQAAIAQFFNPRRNPDAKKEEVVGWIIERAKEAGLLESNKIATSIFAIIKPANHDPKKLR